MEISVMCDHKQKQKYLEWQAIENAIPSIEKTLGLTNVEYDDRYESEEPDFIFMNETKSIGVEVIECHPSHYLRKKDNAPALKTYKNKIRKMFLKNGYLELITKGHDNKLYIIIDCGPKFSSKYEPSSVCSTLEYYLRAFVEGKKVKACGIISRIRVIRTKGHNIVKFNDIRRVTPIRCSFLSKCIEKKNKNLSAYKIKNPCFEYWLCIYLPFEEYKTAYKIVYDSKEYWNVLSKSKFKRVFVTSCLHKDLKWLKGNPKKSKSSNNSIYTPNDKKISKCLSVKTIRDLKNFR